MIQKLVFILFIGLVLRLALSVLIYSGDLNNHMGWGENILSEGSRGAYDRQYVGIMQPTYPPLALYSFVTADWLYQNIYAIAQSLNDRIAFFPSQLIWWLEDQDVRPSFHKIIPIVSDIGIGILIYLLARRLMKSDPKPALIASTLYIFNPAVWYNSSLWGQLESPPVFFVLLSIYLIIKRQPVWAHLAFASAMLFKQSSLILFPAFLVFSIYKSGFKSTIIGLVCQFCLLIIVYLPFTVFKTPFSAVTYPVTVYLHRIAVGSGSDYISDHAFNLWAPFTHLEKISDQLIVFNGLSAQVLGKAAFIFLTLLLTLRYIRTRVKSNIFSLIGLTNLAAFLVLTRMHERYLAPVLPFLAISSAAAPQLWPIYLLVSLAHQINLYHNWWYPTLMWLRPVASHWNLVIMTVVLLVISALAWTAYYYDETRNK